MSSVNEAILLGRVGNDPEVRDINGGRIAKVSLATSRKYKDKEDTQWHRLVIFGKLVDVVERYVRKGDQLYVRGRIEYSTVEGDGGKKYFTDVIVNDLTLLGGSKSGAPSPSDDSSLPY